MSAVIVIDVYKKFGKPTDPFWKHLWNKDTPKNGSGQNGHNGNGKSHIDNTESKVNLTGELQAKLANADGSDKKITVAVDLISFSVETEALCDQIAIMDSGKVVALDTPTALRKQILPKYGKEATLEDVFPELTGKKLVNPEEEIST